MQQTGNKVANAFWEAKLDPASKPQFGTNDVEPFIQRKVSNELAHSVVCLAVAKMLIAY